jgi:EmrB/QacA subfamily drug resistance transporter
VLSKNTLLLLCVSIPSFMINLDSNIVAVSLASIAQSLHAEFSSIEWVISAYTLAFATLLMPAGALADRFGRKRILLIGLAIFTIASGFCGAAPNTTILNLARAAQGIGAAMQLSAALAILSHGFHGRERAKAFAFWGSVIGVGITLGPVAGGFITQVLGWQWAFYINLPIGVLTIALVWKTVVESKDPKAEKIDIAGFATFSTFLGLLTLALISGNRDGWTDNVILIEFAVAFFAFVAFLIAELVQERPMVDLRYFRRATFVGSSVAGVAYAAAFLTMLTYLPFFFQSGLEKSPLQAGLLMLPLALPIFIVPRIVAIHLEHRFSGRALVTTGLGMVSLGLFWTALQLHNFSYWSLLCSMLIASTGAGMLNGQVAKVSMSVIPPERAGMASGISATMRFSGIVIGFATLGAILFQRINTYINSEIGAISSSEKLEISRSIANGSVAAAKALVAAQGGDISLVQNSLGYGYNGIFMGGALLALVAMILSWLLIRSHETAPHEANSPARPVEILLD